MTPVEDETGRRYLLRKRSSDASLVLDPETGTERYVENDRLEPVDESPFETAASPIPAPVRTLLTSVHDEESLGLLVHLADAGPLDVLTILERSTFCESDLHGRLGVLTATGLLAETTVDGRRGYELTPTGADAVALVRGATVDE